MQIGFLPRIIRFLFNHSDQADALIEAFRTTGFTLPLGRLRTLSKLLRVTRPGRMAPR